MKVYIFLFLSLVSICCSTNKKRFLLIDPEYTISEKDKNKGKTLVYLDKQSGEHRYRDNYYQKRDGKAFLVTKFYNEDEVSDSAIELNGKPYEVYSSVFGDKKLIKAEILKDTVIDNQRK